MFFALGPPLMLFLLPFIVLFQWKKTNWFGRYLSLMGLIFAVFAILVVLDKRVDNLFIILLLSAGYLAADIGLLIWENDCRRVL